MSATLNCSSDALEHLLLLFNYKEKFFFIPWIVMRKWESIKNLDLTNAKTYWCLFRIATTHDIEVKCWRMVRFSNCVVLFGGFEVSIIIHSWLKYTSDSQIVKVKVLLLSQDSYLCYGMAATSQRHITHIASSATRYCMDEKATTENYRLKRLSLTCSTHCAIGSFLLARQAVDTI